MKMVVPWDNETLCPQGTSVDYSKQKLATLEKKWLHRCLKRDGYYQNLKIKMLALWYNSLLYQR